MKIKSLIEIPHFMDKIGSLGTVYTYIILSLFLLSIYKFETAIFLIISLTILYAITIPLRIVYFKERPNPIKYENIIEKVKASSFPSLHAARTTIIYIVLSFYFSDFLYTKILLSLIFIIILISRLHKKRHDVIDISAGVILGILSYLITLYFLRLFF